MRSGVHVRRTAFPVAVCVGFNLLSQGAVRPKRRSTDNHIQPTLSSGSCLSLRKLDPFENRSVRPKRRFMNRWDRNRLW